jgi:hypothetical protein
LQQIVSIFCKHSFPFIYYIFPSFCLQAPYHPRTEVLY